MNEFDKQIEKALNTETEIASKMEDIILARIKKQIYEETIMKKRSFAWKALTSVAAVALAVTVFFFITIPGKAIAGSIVKYFAREKTSTVEIEGQTEDTSNKLNQNTKNEMGYVIYYDTERYVLEKGETTDIIKFKDGAADLPPVQMEITQFTDKTAQALHQEILSEKQGKFKTVRDDGTVTAPVDGYKVTLIAGNKSSDVYENIYIVDNQAGGSFLIECKLFVEAEEGHGARFGNMLETFEVVKSSQIATTK